MKRDDLTGLGVGGNKARKLELLCGQARRAGARSLVTVGAAQSNHCRMTAAAGTVLGMEVHLVLAGDRPARAEGNQLLNVLFGAQLHFVGCPEHHWGELEIAREQITDELAAAGAAPHSIPIGGSTPVGALGYVIGYLELLADFAAARIRPAAIVHTSSSGGTHAGLVAGQALARAAGVAAPPVLAIGVAKGVAAGQPDIAELAASALAALGYEPDAARQLVDGAAVELDGSWIGEDYAGPDAGRGRGDRVGRPPRRLGARPRLHRQGARRPARSRRRRPLGSRRGRGVRPHRRPARRLRRGRPALDGTIALCVRLFDRWRRVS